MGRSLESMTMLILLYDLFFDLPLFLPDGGVEEESRLN